MPIPVPGRVAEALRRSTVQVRSGNGYSQGNGSGAVIRPEQIITNAHVLHGSLRIDSWEGKTVAASVLKVDRRRDLALLSAPGLDAPAASLGDSDRLRPGMPLFAIGNPLGFIGAVSSGVVHALGPIAPNALGGLSWIQADIRLAPGNSGGPLADFQGQIVGLNTMVVSGGLALAVPSRAVQAFLARTGSPPALGVVVRPVSVRSGEVGLLILELVPGGAAESASLLPGDVLVRANDKPFRFVDDLQGAIEQASDALLRVDFYRGDHTALRHVAARLRAEPVRTAA
ncbi:MAG TPA: trypsin-like peptidase domain-containing protein [Bryobacteraceae bacterium]|jgi:serine protease Do